MKTNKIIFTILVLLLIAGLAFAYNKYYYPYGRFVSDCKKLGGTIDTPTTNYGKDYTTCTCSVGGTLIIKYKDVKYTNTPIRC